MTPVLNVDTVSKTFTRTKALAGVSMTIEPGEVHALLGQNGSGKSTLIKILSGYHAPDPGGGIRIQGQELPFQSPVGSYRLGCRFVQQDLGLVPTLSVDRQHGAGVGLSHRVRDDPREGQPPAGQGGPGRSSASTSTRRRSSPRSAPRSAPAWPSPVPCVRIRDYPACLLVLDEPTATLPVDEVDHLLDRVAAISATGVGVLYVTHHLGEVFRVANKVSVFRDGIVVGAGPVSDFDHAAIVMLLAGEELISEETEARAAEGRPGGGSQPRGRLRGRGAARRSPRGRVLQRRAGRDRRHRGSGRFRPRQHPRGQLRRAPAHRRRGQDRRNAGATQPPDLAIGRGVAYVAPDRKIGGCVMTMSARENLTLPNLKPFWKGGILRRKRRPRRRRNGSSGSPSGRANAIDDSLGIFSGGNQQKILFGKWLSQKPLVFLLDEPTQGVDVGAKADLHRELVTAADRGCRRDRQLERSRGARRPLRSGPRDRRRPRSAACSRARS